MEKLDLARMPLFSHAIFYCYGPEKLPINQNIFLIDEKYMSEWEEAWLRNDAVDEDNNSPEPTTSPYDVGPRMRASPIRVMSHGLELTWYPNTTDRFHGMKITLPLSEIVQCVEVPKYENIPTVFVREQWLESIHLRSHSLFAMIDVVGMSEELQNGRLDSTQLLALRGALDELAANYTDISFISFADSLLLKTNWTVGTFEKGAYTYSPEPLVRLFAKIRDVFKATLGLDVYAVFASGSNEYYDDPLLHISPSQNHISLNSLGLPFAQIMLIDEAARRAIRKGAHQPHDLYFDSDIFHSLSINDYAAKRAVQHATYEPRLSGSDGKYFFINFADLEPLLASPTGA